MALSLISISDIYSSVRLTTQDTGTRWADVELFEYIDQAVRDIAVRLKSFKKTDTFTVTTDTQDFTFNYEVIELDVVNTALGWELTTNSTISFDTPNQDTEVKVTYYAYPNKMVYGSDTTLDLDLDLRDEVVLYVLFKCYEKEDGSEYLQKAQYFRNRYLDAITQNAIRWHGQHEVPLAKNDFY